MNSHQITEAALNRYESDKRAWDDAIRAYNGQDSLDIWFNYICWLEQHKIFDKDGGFRKILEQCLSTFENFENYKQDVRMVKLWMKFIDMQANPLNLYQFLYKKNVGTQCACFYIGWAHYYDAANAFKQAESIFNLGIQVKAQPMEELQEAQNKFRLSIAQRMLYNDASSKKRSANTLVEQRQQITSLSPPQKKLKTEGGEYYAVQQQQPQQQRQQPQQQQHQPQQQQHQPQVHASVQHQAQQTQQQQTQQHYNRTSYYQQQQQQPQQRQQQQPQQVVASVPATSINSTVSAERYYQQDKQNTVYYQHQHAASIAQHQQLAQHPIHQHQPVPPQPQPVAVQQPLPAQHHPPQRQVQPQSQHQHHHHQQQQQHHHPIHTQMQASVITQSQSHIIPAQNPIHVPTVQQPTQPQPEPRAYSQPTVEPAAPVQPQPTVQSHTQAPPQHPQPQPREQPVPQPREQPVHKSVIIENYALGNESLIECNLNNSAYVISSSLNYVYDDANLTGYTLEEQPVEKVDTEPAGIRLPVNFVREARSNHERWDVPLCLEEPYEANRKCCYPKGVVYPDLATGKPTMEFSLEEIRARKWYRRKEELEEQKKLKQQQLEAEKQRQERQRQMQLQYQQQQQQHQMNYVHHQQLPATTAVPPRNYAPSNQYQQIYQQQSPQQTAHQYQQPARQNTIIHGPPQPVPTIQHANHYYHQPQQNVQQHQQMHHPSNPPTQNQPIQQVQNSPVQPSQHPPVQNSYSAYRHPYPPPQQQQQPQQQQPHPPQSQYQSPVATPVIQHPVQHPASATTPYQQHSPYQNSQYAGYNQQNYTAQPPAHHVSPVQAQSPHHHPPQHPSAQHQHQHHPHQQQTQQPAAPPQHHQPHLAGQQQPRPSYAPQVQARSKTPVQQPTYHKPAPQPAPQPAAAPVPRPKTPLLQPPPKPAPATQPIHMPTPPAQQTPKLLPPKQPQKPPLRPPAVPIAGKPMTCAKTSNFSDCDDFEEQIEASTIRFSTSAENGTSKSKTITIKFKKEKVSNAAPSPPVNHQPKQPISSASMASNHDSGNKTKKLHSSGMATNSNSVAHHHQPQQQRKNVASSSGEQRSKPNSKKSKSAANKTKSKCDPNATVVPANRVNDANLLLSLSREQDDSSRSYDSSPGIARKKNKSKSKARYIDDDEDEADEYDQQNDEYLDSDEDEFDDDDDDDSDENDSSYQSNSEFNTSFSNISFAGDNSNGAFNFGGSSCSTPLRQTSGGVSKMSTPIGSFRYLKKHESNLSLGQNEDSMSSTVVENSYFQTEQDEEAKRRRKEKALAIIDTHMAKPFLDPFSSELCKAFLTKIDFPTRENMDNYKVVNNNLPKLIKSQTASLGGTTFSIEKEVGRGSYGSVFRALNTQTGAVVAVKYQKPANTWELYVCTEVKKRIKNPEILPGFMDICSAVIAPNASVLISEFSQYGSLLDINNKIRTATTKVMHESLVMHFSSQILAIVDYLHGCNIVHADIKPDNFLLMQIPTVESDIPTLRLIDFGCAIDMNFFEEKRQFKKVIQTDGFTCIEMQEGRPWSFQTDLFCVAGTIHVMLFGEYMQLTKKYDSDWDIKQKLPRYLKKHVWTEVFQKLLNIKDIDHMPKLGTLKELIDAEAFNMESELVKHIRALSNLLKRR